MSDQEHSPAFAIVSPSGEIQYGGLTKREYAAIHIAAGFAANSIPGGQHAEDRLTDEAVRKADALLARLQVG